MQPFPLFELGRVPVLVSPWYLLLLIYFGWSSGDPVAGLIGAVVVTLSLLVHEFGHALTARAYQLEPAVLLHGFGGLTVHRPAGTDGREALIVAAGPAAGLALGVLCIVGLFAGDALAPGWREAYPALAMAAGYGVFINIFWSLINLLPMHPLDGGQLFRLLLRRLAKPRTAELITHGVGAAVALVATVLAWQWFGMFLGAIIGFLLFMQNIQALQRLRREAPGGARSPASGRFVKGLLADATTALQQGDYREAARLAHQARAEPHLADADVERAFAVLAHADAHLGDYEQSLRWADRVKKPADVIEARLLALAGLDDLDALREALATPAAQRLPTPVRQRFEAAARGG